MSFKKISNKRTLIIGAGQPIEVDAVLSESHKSSKTYTRYPTEFGRFAFDNAVKVPEEVEMTILVTDTPTAEGAQIFEGRHRVVYSQLKVWQDLSLPVVLIMELRSYVNMYIEDVNPVKSIGDGNSIKLNLKFVEVPIAGLGLASLAANLLVDPDIAYSATDVVPIGVI